MPDQLDLFSQPPVEEPVKPQKPKDLGPRILYFDLETQKSADEVGGWGNIKDMLMAVGVVWDSHDPKHHVYYGEPDKKDGPGYTDLIDHLKSADLVVGFNVIGFDYTVIQGAASQRHIDLLDIPTFDMLVDFTQKKNHRIKLDNLAGCTLGTKKSADGLISLQWWKEYLGGDKIKLDQIVEYCKQDVNVTRDLFLFGKDHGYVEYDGRSGQRLRLNVDWTVETILKSPHR
ncbi:ribonuclease H-like domain-containing protein [Nitrospina watsonii]|uniref:ATP-dependent DEAD/DEAH box helicase family protein n=1 Tax=Nitrospina watsonii TaxID=1323948 RepID=A0ABN8W0T5_9BACT|nr:ribonuclease H-like domain-containing protein [Nitrospina watsonii]CAI2718043.1 ATP-dependent DEAD/DEAH box helicase family protein [Nitrospina watsonii]